MPDLPTDRTTASSVADHLADHLILAAMNNGLVDVNRRTANYTLAATDAGGIVEMNVAGANTLTIPADATYNFPIGTTIEVMQYGAGQTTIAGEGGVTIRSPGGKTKIAAQYGTASLRKIAANEWALEGNITT